MGGGQGGVGCMHTHSHTHTHADLEELLIIDASTTPSPSPFLTTNHPPLPISPHPPPFFLQTTQNRPGLERRLHHDDAHGRLRGVRLPPGARPRQGLAGGGGAPCVPLRLGLCVRACVRVLMWLGWLFFRGGYLYVACAYGVCLEKTHTIKHSHGTPPPPSFQKTNTQTYQQTNQPTNQNKNKQTNQQKKQNKPNNQQTRAVCRWGGARRGRPRIWTRRSRSTRSGPRKGFRSFWGTSRRWVRRSEVEWAGVCVWVVGRDRSPPSLVLFIVLSGLCVLSF